MAIEDELLRALPRLRRFARSLCQSPEEADDLVQAACERAIRRAERYEPGTRFDSWMYRLMQNLWIDTCRSRRSRGQVVEVEELRDEPGSDGRVTTEARLTLARVRAAMRLLPEEQRLVLVLVAVEGLSYKQTAARLEVPIGTVMSRLARARRRLHELVTGEAAALPQPA